jgi:hypothetical protein
MRIPSGTLVRPLKFMTAQQKTANEIVASAIAGGATPEINGQWIKWSGPISAPVLMAMSKVPDAELLKAVQDHLSNK